MCNIDRISKSSTFATGERRATVSNARRGDGIFFIRNVRMRMFIVSFFSSSMFILILRCVFSMGNFFFSLDISRSFRVRVRRCKFEKCFTAGNLNTLAVSFLLCELLIRFLWFRCWFTVPYYLVHSHVQLQSRQTVAKDRYFSPKGVVLLECGLFSCNEHCN